MGADAKDDKPLDGHYHSAQVESMKNELTTNPPTEPSELAKQIARVANVAFGDFTALGLTPNEVATLTKRISTAGVAELEAERDLYRDAFNGKHPTCRDSSCVIPACREVQGLEARLATATEAWQSCRKGWNGATDYCHELGARLMLVKQRLASVEQRYETSHTCRLHAERALETVEGERDAALGRLEEIKELHVHDGYCGTCVHDFACPTYRLATDSGGSG